MLFTYYLYRLCHQDYVVANFKVAKFTGKRLCQSFFFNKVADQHLCQSFFFNKVPGPANFAKFLRTPFLTEHLR